MSNPSGPSGGNGGLFNTTDPFHADAEARGEAEHEPERITTRQDDENDEEQLRLAGVRSNNPFASDGGHVDEHTTPDPESAVSPTANDHALPSVGSTVPTVQETDEEGPPSAISPGAGRDTTINPFDHAGSEAEQATAGASDEVGSPTDLRPVTSHINGDRAERGTDIYADADPVFPEMAHESSEDSNKDSESDSGPKVKAKRVGFQDHDTIDKAVTQEEDSASPDVMDKIKSTLSNVKDKIHIHDIAATGPFKLFNPTKVRMNVRVGDDPDSNVGIIWRSRDNRKGRNSVVIPRASMAYPNLPPKNRPVYSSSFKGVGRNLYRMVFTFPYWDMAFWSGWSYTWGSVLFTIDSIWAWGPVGWDVKWAGIEKYGVGFLFFFGALLYQVGATMAYLEAVNDGSFHGSAMKRFLEGHEDDKKKLLDEKIHRFFGNLHPLHSKRQHAEDEAEEKKLREIDPEAGWKTLHRRERPGSIYPGGKTPGPRRGGVDLGEAEEGESHEYLTWRWWPTWHALKTHHRYEIGYIACSVQLFGATLYSWCGLVSVPGVESNWTSPDWYGGYYFPEIFGSCCFLTASLMFLIETQERWYKPQLNVVGWWIGFWAMIGSLGFLFIGVFGVIDEATGAHWAEYQSECSSTWGSFAYLLSSLCQWYEAVNKHPVEELFNEPGEIKSYQVHLP